MAKTRPVGARVVERIAAREGVDPLDLDVQLYDVIDADALDALTNSADNRDPQGSSVSSFRTTDTPSPSTRVDR